MSVKDNLKARILAPAVQQINRHSNLLVSWTQIKQGRKIVGFAFRFRLKSDAQDRPAQARSVAQPKERFTREAVAARAFPGETWEQARARIEGLGEREATRNL